MYKSAATTLLRADKIRVHFSGYSIVCQKLNLLIRVRRRQAVFCSSPLPTVFSLSVLLTLYHRSDTIKVKRRDAWWIIRHAI